MVSLDTGTGSGTPRVYECQQCDTTLVSSQAPESVVCCGDEMVELESGEGALTSPDIETLLRDVFGLSHNAIVICIVVIERGPITTGEIAEVVDVSASTVTDVLGSLVEAGILKRYERNLTTGGTVNVYDGVSLEEQRRIYRRALYQWVSRAINVIDGFDLDALKAEYGSDDPMDTDPVEQAAIYWDGGADSAPTD